MSNTVGSATCNVKDLMTKQQPSIKIPIITVSTSMTTSAGTGKPP